MAETVLTLANGKRYRELKPLQDTLRSGTKIETPRGWLHKDVLEEIATIDPAIAEAMKASQQITETQARTLFEKALEKSKSDKALEKAKNDSKDIQQGQQGQPKNDPQPQVFIHRMSTFGILMSILSALLFLGILLALLFRKTN